MIHGETFGLLVALGVVASIVLWLPYTFQHRRNWIVPAILGVGLALAGSFLNHWVIYSVYGGIADATGYYDRGVLYADYFARLDFRPLTDATLWYWPTWWGTQFVYYPSALVMLAVGPSMLGGFIIFGLLALAGRLLIVAACSHALPGLRAQTYLLTVMALPSLWYWTSVMGKDALVMLGLGLAFYGWIGRDGRKQLVWLGLGILLMFLVRPHVAAVALISITIAEAVGLFLLRKPVSVSTVVLLAAGAVIPVFALTLFGIDAGDVSGVTQFANTVGANTAIEGSAIAPRSTGLAAIPGAFVNMWFRPFPWEAERGVQVLASLELVFLWGWIMLNGRSVWALLRDWRHHRILWFAIPFVLIYTLMMGMVVNNLGILARQRVFIFPFLLLLAAYRPARAAVRIPVRQAMRNSRRPSRRRAALMH